MLIEHAHIASTPISEPWTAWVMLFLLLMGVLANQRQSGLVASAFKGLFAKTKRSYSDTVSDLLDSIYIGAFRFGTLAMVLYVALFAGHHFGFWTYLLVVGIVLLNEGIRQLLILVVRYVFSLQRATDQLMVQYASLWVAAAVCLYPTALLMINLGTQDWMGILCYVLLGLLAVSYVIILTIKVIRTLYTGLLSILYIILYMLTLEVLPIVVLTFCVKLLLTYNI